MYDGAKTGIIIMSYEGVNAELCDLTDTILDRIASAFSAIHGNCVHHGDVTLRNILVNGDKISVIDFEAASICDRDSPTLEGEQEVVERACARVKKSGDNDHFLGPRLVQDAC